MLVIVPTSPRICSIIAGILTIFEFIFPIYYIISSKSIQYLGLQVLFAIFSIFCIFTSLLLIIAAVRLIKRLIVPYLLSIGLFDACYVIAFLVMISVEEGSQRRLMHITIIGKEESLTGIH